MSSFKGLFGWLDPEVYILVKIAAPAMSVMFFSIVAGYVYKSKDLSPWIIGNSFLQCTYNAIFGVGMVFIEERSMGTLKLIIASPSSKFVIILSKMFMHIFDAAITVVVGLLTGTIFFSFTIPKDKLLWFAFTIIVAMFLASGFGILIGSFGLVTRDINMLLNVSSSILFIFTGADFPISRLPHFLQGAAYILPLTRSINAARIIQSGGNISGNGYLLLGEAVVGIIYMALGYLLLNIMEYAAKRRATLDVY